MGAVKIKQAAEIEKERMQALADGVRAKRNALLLESDFMAMPDYPAPPDGLNIYRQALRDITAQAGFPESVIWPEL